MKKILHPTDFGPQSRKLFQMVCTIARDQGAEIVVLYVVVNEQVPTEEGQCRPVPETSPLFQDVRVQYQEMISQEKGVATAFRIYEGPLVRVVAEVAAQEQCDLIALASMRHSYVERQCHGSIADSLVYMAPCPVLCFRDGFGRQTQHGMEHMHAVDADQQQQKDNPVPCVERQW